MPARRRPPRPLVTIVTPYGAAANNGNWQTAARWARMLRGPYRVRIVTEWQAGDPVPALLIALHARRSAASVEAFAKAHPERPLVLVLTGTDLYRDIAVDASARASLLRARRLVVLNPLGTQRLPAALRPRAAVIVQSAAARRPARKPARFTVAVVGHLRDEKNPALVWRVLEGWPPEVPLRVLHVGRALDPALGARARQVARRDPRYIWLGDQPRGQVRRRVGSAHVLLHPSAMEGGALAVIEAVAGHTPVVGSRIDGNVGLLGADYPGWFPPDNADGARDLLLRAATDPRFLARLARHCDQIAPRFSPAREQRDLRRVVEQCLRQARGQSAARPAR